MFHVSSSPLTSPFASASETGVLARPGTARLSVEWARSEADIRAAQRLRHLVFVQEMGARSQASDSELETDIFDPFCEHLLVRDGGTAQVVGTHRLMTPDGVRRVGCSYADTQFDLLRLRELRHRTVELGRSCVHPAHRHGGVIRALWSALLDFMHRSGLDVMMGCTSIPLLRQGPATTESAAATWSLLSEKHGVSVAHRVRPRFALPLEHRTAASEASVPPLLSAYMRLGAELLGPPSWDRDFNVADVPMLLRIDRLPLRYQRFLGAPCRQRLT